MIDLAQYSVGKMVVWRPDREFFLPGDDPKGKPRTEAEGRVVRVDEFEGKVYLEFGSQTTRKHPWGVLPADCWYSV